MESSDKSMTREEKFEQIKAISGSKESECSCNKCRNMCQVPCLGTPQDIKALIDAGLKHHLKPTIWVAGLYFGVQPIDMVQLNSDDLGCFLFENGLCQVHGSGLKPTEGKLAMHRDTALVISEDDFKKHHLYLVANEWTKPENKELIDEINSIVK